MNERGQEGLTLTTLLLIILGVVAVVVIILFFNGFFGKLNNATNNLPSDLQAAVTACELAGSSSLTADYCATFRKITVNGVEQYQTCTFPAIQNLMDKNKVLVSGCGSATTDPASYCQSQKLSKNTVVGDKKCSGDYSKTDSSTWTIA